MLKNNGSTLKKQTEGKMLDRSVLFKKDYQVVTNDIVSFIRVFFRDCPRQKVILGLSGGIDSAVVASLHCLAIGPENIHVIIMPAPNSSEASVCDAYDQASALGIPSKNVRYKKIDKILASFGYDENGLRNGNLGSGNTAARIRMALLFKVADEIGAVVSGTENMTEHLLGYFTIGGDEVSIIEPIHHLYKTEIRKLAEHLGVIEAIRNKKPSAELWDGQTDEDELGFSYDDADVVLASLSNATEFYGIPEEVVKKVESRKRYSHFKRVLPYCINR